MLIGRYDYDFSDDLFDFVNHNESFDDKVYYHPGDVPTIGYGYALLERSNGEWIVDPNLATDFSGIHSFSSAEIRLLAKITADKNDGDEVAAHEAFHSREAGILDFTITAEEAKALFLDAVAVNVASAGLTGISQSANMSNTYEMIALEDLGYNSPKIANGTISYVDSDDRLDTWDYILTHNGVSAKNLVKGVENRRIKEADEFGLYSDGDGPGATDEALTVVRYLDVNAGALRKYMAGKLEPRAKITSFIAASYMPADNSLITAYGEGLTIADVVAFPDNSGDTVNLAAPPGYGKSRKFVVGNALVVGGTGDDTFVFGGNMSKMLGLGSVVLYRANGGTDLIDCSTLKSNETIEIEAGPGVANVDLGINETLALASPTQYTGIINDLGTGDTIDLIYTDAIAAKLIGNDTLAVTENGGSVFDLALAPGVDYSDFVFGVHTDGNDGTDITIAPAEWHTITFSEYAIGTAITDQYENLGILFGGASPFIATDSADPTSPALSGTPLFNGEIKGKFVNPNTDKLGTVTAFALDAGYFNNLHSTKLIWYGASGQILGHETNAANGYEHFYVTSKTPIASWSIGIISPEPAGFSVDNVSFGKVT